MANRFWNKQNASQNWNATAPTNWSSVSLVVVNAAIPTASDDVFFDGLGGGANDCTFNSNQSILSLDMTGYGNQFVHNSGVTLTIAGNGVTCKFAGTYVGNQTSSGILFTGTSGTTLFTPPSTALRGTTINGVGGAVQLQSALTGDTIFLEGGTLDTNGKAVTLTDRFDNTIITNSRTLTLGASALSMPGWNCTTTNFTVTANTATVTLTGASSTLAFGGINWNGLSVIVTGTGKTISGSNTFSALTFNPSTAQTLLFTASTTQTVTTFTCNGTGSKQLTLNSTSAGTKWNIAISGSSSASYVTVKDSTATGAGTPVNDATGGINSGNNTGWTFPGGLFRVASLDGLGGAGPKNFIPLS